MAPKPGASPPPHPSLEPTLEKAHPPTLSAGGSGEPGPEAGRDWARVGFTVRLAEYESLRAEIALYAALGETDAEFTKRLRECLVLKAQEALTAVAETREMIRGEGRR
ncbi:MAG: hypothetical protein WAN74_05980 [Thermoplasmata archaeon]